MNHPAVNIALKKPGITMVVFPLSSSLCTITSFLFLTCASLTQATILSDTAPAAFITNAIGQNLQQPSPLPSRQTFASRTKWKQYHVHHKNNLIQQSESQYKTIRSMSISGESDTATTTKPCFYKREEDKWRRRLNLADLKIGQKLYGMKIDSCDLLQARTGPKIFFECGVGRTDKKGNWHIVNGMLRLGTPWTKKSVTFKRAKRLSGKIVELYVSKIRLDNGHLEVCTNIEDALMEGAANEGMVSASTLKAGDELVGTVVRLEPYGVFVDVGANRNGLLHIQRVADLYGRYIDKEKGLKSAGLERGAKIRVAVRSNEKKRLALDFTEDIKVEAEDERKAQEAEKKAKEEGKEEAKDSVAAVVEGKVDEKGGDAETSNDEEDDSYGYYDIDDDEAAAWAAYADEGYGDYDDDDEDRDIEDALGIGTY